MRVNVPSGKNTSECPSRRLRRTRRASARAAVAVEALDEFAPSLPQQQRRPAVPGHLALDHEAKARRQRRGEHDAVEVAGVVETTTHWPLGTRSANFTVSGMPARCRNRARQRPRCRAAPMHPRQHQSIRSAIMPMPRNTPSAEAAVPERRQREAHGPQWRSRLTIFFMAMSDGGARVCELVLFMLMPERSCEDHHVESRTAA